MMDEKDLAEHDFRNETSAGRSLDEFQENQEMNIYDQYREMKEKNKELKDKESERQRAEKMREMAQEASGNMVDPPTYGEYLGNEAKGQTHYDKFNTVEEEERLE